MRGPLLFLCRNERPSQKSLKWSFAVHHTKIEGIKIEQMFVKVLKWEILCVMIGQTNVWIRGGWRCIIRLRRRWE